MPKKMRGEMLNRIHEGHLGVVKCKNRARESMFWPGITSQIEDIVSACTTCLHHRDEQAKEPMMSHEIPDRPWQKVGTDLFTWKGKEFLLVADYYSKFTEYALLPDTTSPTVIRYMKSIFSRHGIPEEVISDNGPSYASREFAKFAQKWDFKHTTSSPRYPQSNGFAEKMVGTTKKILQKAEDSGQDPYLAMLNWRTTPSSDMPSPAEILMGRKPRTRITLSKPCRKDSKIKGALQKRQVKSKTRYDKSSRTLPTLQTNEKVRVRDHKTGKWFPGVVVGKADTPRSYVVDQSGAIRRNRRDLMKLTRDTDSRRSVRNEDKIQETDQNAKAQEMEESQSTTKQHRSGNNDMRLEATPDLQEADHSNKTVEMHTSKGSHTPTVSRSGRQIKPPSAMKDYVTY